MTAAFCQKAAPAWGCQSLLLCSCAIQAALLLLVGNEGWQPFHQQQSECRLQGWCFKVGSFVCACEEAQVAFEEEVWLNGCFLKQPNPLLAGCALLAIVFTPLAELGTLLTAWSTHVLPWVQDETDPIC